ncbi:MAG: hypothetical protein A2Z74_04370 [Chloroflexi bacterium RBG_13_46_9]|jgi:uncharacterized protein (TIGR00251 family)|nr:MAG: hypothetical protein A2Z74_04370 [Chloroflexi bacterium RBG_13_46_9]
MTKQEKSTKILVQVHPSAKRNEILRFENGIWHLKIAAPPVEGKANKELVDFLSEVLKVSKSRISIEKGATSRKKLIAVEGMTEADIHEHFKTA